MADFAGIAEGAAEGRAVLDHAEAEAGAEIDHGEAGDRMSRAEKALAHSRGVGVVFDGHRLAAGLAQKA